MILPIPSLIFISLILSVVAIEDIRFRKIKNMWSLLNIFTFLVHFYFFSQFYGWNSIFHCVAILLVSFALFRVKIMGGGDGKFLSTFYLMLPLQWHFDFSLYICGFTSIIAIGKILSNWSNKRALLGSKIPFAPVLLLSWLSLLIGKFLPLF